LLIGFTIFGLLSCEKDDNKISYYDFNVFDIIPDLADNRLYIIERDPGEISIIDYEAMTVVKSVTTDAVIGYCSLGNYRNQNELYVPAKDGRLLIYNAETLEEIDYINLSRSALCAVNNNGILFISTDVWPGSIRVVNRASRSLVSQGGDNEDSRLMIIPNTNTGIIEVTTTGSPIDVDYFGFNSSGIVASHKDDIYHGDYPVSAAIFQFFPDGLKYICSNAGAIYDLNMKYVNRISKGGELFADFAFNADGSIIYGARSNMNMIVSYSYPDLTKIGEYKTEGNPYKIFRKDNVLICVCKTQLFKINIEKIELEQ
jgi:hypothetical protein